MLQVELTDAVARLQKELEEFRTESGYGSARRSAAPTQTSGRSGFTSTPVPRYAGGGGGGGAVGINIGKCLRLLFVRTDGTESRQPFSLCLEGDALNVTLLVPAGALSEHYSSPGRLAEYKRQFERDTG